MKVSKFALLAFAALLSLSVIAIVESRRTTWSQLTVDYSFEQYALEHHKVYEDAVEYKMRKAIFERELAHILRHNSEGHSWKMGVNRFTDRTTAEFKKVLGYRKDIAYKLNAERGLAKAVPQPLTNEDRAALADLPSSVDWRDADVVTDVKDQGSCGSCWTFATSETVESHWALHSGELAVLSEQQIASCVPNPNDCGGTGGCEGGIPEIAYEQLMTMGGLASEWTYPYVSYRGDDYPCMFDQKMTPPVAPIASYIKLPPNDYVAVMNATALVGPLAINVDATAWYNYESGVFTGCDMVNPDLDHVVQLVGYGVDEESDAPYWLVRNSWAPSWGEEGYIRLARDTTGNLCGVDTTPLDGTGCVGGSKNQTVCGSCGVLFDVSYPIIAN